MNTVTSSTLGQKLADSTTVPVSAPSSAKVLAALLLAGGVAALVVIADQWMDSWAESHVLAAWLALWAVAAVAMAVLRGVTRALAQNLMSRLDAWSAHVAHRRADERLWSMAQTDRRLMTELQTAMDRAADDSAPAKDVTTLMARRTSRLLKNRQYYI